MNPTHTCILIISGYLQKLYNTITANTDTQIVLATHSRHLLDALSEYTEAKLYWVKDGAATHHELWSDVSVLMDLGALDRGEMLLNGQFRFLVWTEDSDTKYLEKLLEANGFPLDETFIFSYRTSSKIDAAALMLSFVQRVRPGVKLIIHRDRDFMSDHEIERLKKKYCLPQGTNVGLLITKFSDVEGYFTQPLHIAAALDLPVTDAEVFVSAAVQENNNEFVLKFRDKREEIKKVLYKNDEDNCPAVTTLYSRVTNYGRIFNGKIIAFKARPEAAGKRGKTQTNYSWSPTRFTIWIFRHLLRANRAVGRISEA